MSFPIQLEDGSYVSVEKTLDGIVDKDGTVYLRTDNSLRYRAVATVATTIAEPTVEDAFPVEDPTGQSDELYAEYDILEAAISDGIDIDNATDNTDEDVDLL